MLATARNRRPGEQRMSRASYWRDWQGMSPAARLLIINGLAFNLGFYMMMPFLAQHMGSGLGLAGWACGLVMGMRVFSQQGLFLLGGTLGDRIGYHTAIVWGCLVRSVGFLLLGWAESLPILLLAAALTGFAGALFTPCAQAYLASECSPPSQRQRAFALHNLTSQAGMLLGPLVGLTLTQQSYALTGLLAASLFALLGMLQYRVLPKRPVDNQTPHGAILSQWRDILRQRPFMRFTLLAGSYQILFHQLYLALPAHIQSLPDATHLLGGVFTLSAVIGVMLQLPASRLVERHLGVPLAMGLGIGLMGLSYLALPLLSPWPTVGVLAQVALLSLGSILCFPLFAAQLPRYAPSDQLASYYGFYASAGGCMALFSNLLIGFMLGDAGTRPATAIWLLLALAGVLAGFGLYSQLRSGKHGSSPLPE
ncbi:MFS transporter [Aeromonas salmonicida]|uniref:MFS transporter n=1 Tax=Aeromonas salmonicida TaxID=645 RepID=UPI000B5F3A0B|nr:MFS transporter [Aeromonas salmonicida]ARW82249.1 major facilitator transporter [Aeromonas salmonicida]